MFSCCKRLEAHYYKGWTIFLIQTGSVLDQDPYSVGSLLDPDIGSLKPLGMLKCPKFKYKRALDIWEVSTVYILNISSCHRTRVLFSKPQYKIYKNLLKIQTGLGKSLNPNPHSDFRLDPGLHKTNADPTPNVVPVVSAESDRVVLVRAESDFAQC